MKQFIVMVSMIVLGIFIYSLIAGGEDSIAGALRGVWRSSIEARTYAP